MGGKNRTRSERQENIENSEFAMKFERKTVSKKGLVNTVKSRILNRKWTVVTGLGSHWRLYRQERIYSNAHGLKNEWEE